MKPHATSKFYRLGAFGAMLLLALAATLFAPNRSTGVVHANGPVCGPMDVAFVIDDTGSMGGAIGNVKAELAGILGDIETASGNDYRLALETFKDGITIHDNFAANNRAVVEPNILALVAGGGAGAAEASDEALNTAVNALPAAGRPQNIDFTPAYRAGALKIAILVTDAPPGGFDDTYTVGVDDVNAHTRALEALAKSIKISAIFVPTGGDYAGQRAIMMDYAATSGGVFIETAADGSGTGAAIRDIIAKCGSGKGPDLTVTKELKPGQPTPKDGGTLAYMIRVRNAGNEPTPAGIDVMLRDTPQGNFMSWTANGGVCSWNGTIVECKRGRMAVNEEWWVEIKVRLPIPCTQVTNRVTVDPLNQIKETNETNNSASRTDAC